MSLNVQDRMFLFHLIQDLDVYLSVTGIVIGTVTGDCVIFTFSPWNLVYIVAVVVRTPPLLVSDDNFLVVV